MRSSNQFALCMAFISLGVIICTLINRLEDVERQVKTLDAQVLVLEQALQAHE